MKGRFFSSVLCTLPPLKMRTVEYIMYTPTANADLFALRGESLDVIKWEVSETAIWPFPTTARACVIGCEEVWLLLQSPYPPTIYDHHTAQPGTYVNVHARTQT